MCLVGLGRSLCQHHLFQNRAENRLPQEFCRFCSRFHWTRKPCFAGGLWRFTWEPWHDASRHQTERSGAQCLMVLQEVYRALEWHFATGLSLLTLASGRRVRSFRLNMGSRQCWLQQNYCWGFHGRYSTHLPPPPPPPPNWCRYQYIWISFRQLTL